MKGTPVAMFGLLGLVTSCHRVEPPEFLEGVMLVADTGNGRILQVDASDGRVLGEQCVREAFPERCRTRTGSNACSVFGLETAPDGKAGVVRAVIGLRERADSDKVGSVIQFSPDHPMRLHWALGALGFPEEMSEHSLCSGHVVSEDLRLNPDPWEPEESEPDPRCKLEMPHVAVSAAGRQGLVIADTLNSRVLWLDQPGPGNSTRVLAKLDVGHPEWEGLRYPNNVQRLEIEGRDHLLTTFKSGDFPEVARDNTGRIVLWDIEDLEDIRRVWRYPEEGFLAAVHHGQVFDTPSGPLLVYAHSAGASEGFVGGLHGSVGLARFNGLEPPTYLADGLADPLEVEPFGFLREAEILEDGAALLVTDSGCENQSAACVSDGRVMSFRLPALEPSGTSGAFTATHETQTFVSLENFGHVFAWGMKFPFEADLLRGEAQLATWGRPGVGFCEGEVGSDTSSDTGWESMEPLPRGEEVSP